MKFYLHKENLKQGILTTYAEPNDKTIEYEAMCLPLFPILDKDGVTVREMTGKELVQFEKRVLRNNEVIIGDDIISYNIDTQKVVDGVIVDKTRQEMIDDGFITLETELSKIRNERSKVFKAWDIYKTNCSIGVHTFDDELLTWYNEWLDLPANYTDITDEPVYPVTPSEISYYL
jgi:hypothetical protein